MNGYDVGGFVVANILVTLLKQTGWRRSVDEVFLVLLAFACGVVDLSIQGKLVFGPQLYMTLGLIYTSARLNYEFLLRHIPLVRDVGGWNAWAFLARFLSAIARAKPQ